VLAHWKVRYVRAESLQTGVFFPLHALPSHTSADVCLQRPRLSARILCDYRRQTEGIAVIGAALSSTCLFLDSCRNPIFSNTGLS
jgi:hypothetical protein